MSDHGEHGLPALLHAEEAAKLGPGTTNLICDKTYLLIAHDILDTGGK